MCGSTSYRLVSRGRGTFGIVLGQYLRSLDSDPKQPWTSNEWPYGPHQPWKSQGWGPSPLGENWIRARFFFLFLFVIGSRSFVHPPNYQKYWFKKKQKYERQWPMGGVRPGTIGLVTWPKKIPPKFWTSTIFMPKSRHKWRYDMEILTFFTKPKYARRRAKGGPRQNVISLVTWPPNFSRQILERQIFMAKWRYSR